MADAHPEAVDVQAIDAAVLRTSGTSDFGLGPDGFRPKPFARLLAEKLALARALFGDDLDLTSGSALRKLIEITALEDARTWAALAAMYEDGFIVSATGEALGRLGEEVALPRPSLEARGSVRIQLVGQLPQGFSPLVLPRGARLLSAGGHHASLDESVSLSTETPEREVAVTAFYPGPEHNLDPVAAAADGTFPQRLDRWNLDDESLQASLVAALTAAQQANRPLEVRILHTQRLSGGELRWPDTRYRRLLLQAPRSIWTADALRIAISLVPGVRQVTVRDGWGGLDLNQSIFGNFNFLERVFASERDLGSPYYCTILVAPTPSAIWLGPDGLAASVESAIEDVRPVGILPQVEKAEEVGVGVAGDLVVRGLPLPTGSRVQVNASAPAQELKRRLLARVARYVDALQFGEPVRAAEITWALMSEPGIADVRNLALLRYPPAAPVGGAGGQAVAPQRFECGQNVDLKVNQVAVLVDDPTGLQVV